jgi:hypothetical protein
MTIVRCPALFLIASIMACNPSSGQEPAALQESYQGAIGTSDQTPLLQLEHDHTNSRDIAVIGQMCQGSLSSVWNWPKTKLQKGSVALTTASVVFLEGSYSYVAVENNASGGGLAVINVPNPAAPTQSSMTSSSGHGAGLTKSAIMFT